MAPYAVKACACLTSDGVVQTLVLATRACAEESQFFGFPLHA